MLSQVRARFVYHGTPGRGFSVVPGPGSTVVHMNLGGGGRKLRAGGAVVYNNRACTPAEGRSRTHRAPRSRGLEIEERRPRALRTLTLKWGGHPWGAQVEAVNFTK